MARRGLRAEDLMQKVGPVGRKRLMNAILEHGGDGRDKPADGQSSASPAKTRPSRAGRKCWVGSLKFDSETERNLYIREKRRNQAVIAHGRIALAADSHIEPDFVEVIEVYPDGTFHGRLADAKGAWRDKKTGRKKAHVEKDFATKCKWLHDATGLVVRILTKEDDES